MILSTKEKYFLLVAFKALWECCDDGIFSFQDGDKFEEEDFARLLDKIEKEREQ